MIRSIGRTVVLVHDYDEALQFYQGILGFETIVDVDAGGGMRYVHIAPPGENSGLWLLEATSENDRLRVGDQAGPQPFMVFYTDDAQADFDSMTEHGVNIIRPIVETNDAAFFHFGDLYGNEIVMVELKQNGIEQRE